MGDLYRREGSPYWYAVLEDPTAPRGVQRRSTQQRDKRKAREVAAAWQAELDRLHQLTPVGLPFTQAALHYIEDGPLSDTTRRGHASMANKIVESSLGDFDLATLTHEQIKAFINERRQHLVRPHNKPDAESTRRISDETLRRFLAFMSAVYRHCINHGLFNGPNPLATFDRSILAKKKPGDRQLRERQVSDVLKVLKDEPARIVTVLALTGMRASELINLRWRQVDMRRKLIDLGAPEEHRTKTNRSRVVPFNEQVLTTLRTQKEALQKSSDYGPDRLVFPSPRKDKEGRRTIARYSLAGILKTVKSKSKLKGYTNHRLRHSFASWMLEKDLDPITIRDLLGHQTLHTTTIYARRLAESTVKRVQKVPLPKLVRDTKAKR